MGNKFSLMPNYVYERDESQNKTLMRNSDKDIQEPKQNTVLVKFGLEKHKYRASLDKLINNLSYVSNKINLNLSRENVNVINLSTTSKYSFNALCTMLNG